MTITPFSFDQETAREMTGDAQARLIEAKARSDADTDNFDPPRVVGESYFDQVQAQMRYTVYVNQYTKRIERIRRKAAGATHNVVN